MMSSHLSPAIRLTIAESRLFEAARAYARPSEKQHTVATIHEMCQEDEAKARALLDAAEMYAAALLTFKGSP